MTLTEFSEQLRAIVPEGEGLRPLLCEGNPLACEVAIIGINPATTTPFWPYWNDQSGMKRAAWIEAYKVQHGGFKRSRAALERFIPKIAGNVVEINAFATQSKRLADLQKQHKTSTLLDFLLGTIRPKVVVYAGAAAFKTASRTSQSLRAVEVQARHFIYWGNEYETELAEQVNRAIRMNRRT